MFNDKKQLDIMTEQRHQFKSKNTSFGQQEIKFEDTPLFFPEGYEKIFLLFYIATLPYITGLIFTFIFLSNNNYALFLSMLETTPLFLTWAIGYEVLASLTLLYIIKMAISFSKNASKKGAVRNFKRPV